MSRPAANTLCVRIHRLLHPEIIPYFLRYFYCSKCDSVARSILREYSVDNHAALHVHMHGMSRHAGTCISMVQCDVQMH